jgi:radical SAM superfamily enzyme YgiQ (UPF0313 family)
MIYLVQVDYSKFYSTDIMPLGLLHVGSTLANKGFEVRIIHCTEKEIECYAKEIAVTKPLWVGFSVMTGPQTLHSALMSEKIKEYDPTLPVIWGGIHPSLLPEQCLNEDYIDVVVIGDGEDTALELTERIERKKSLDGLLGTGFKKNRDMVLNAPRPFVENLDDDLYRINFNLLDFSKYFTQARTMKRVVAYKTSRGCPYNCSFCYNQKFNHRKWRGKTPERVIEDIKFLKTNYHIDGVMFYDDTFYVDKERALKILEGIGIPAKTDIRIDLVNENLLNRMKELKVFDILIGIESGSDRILKILNKGITVEDIKRVVKLLAKYNLRVGYSAIIGLPRESEAEKKETIELLLWIHSVHKNKTITVGPYLPYPGSKLYEIAIEDGFIPPKDTKGWGMADRWSKELRLPWVNDDGIYRIREYFKFFNYNVPFLDAIGELRLRHNWLKFPWDINLIDFLLQQAIDKKSVFNKPIRNFHQLFKREITA